MSEPQDHVGDLRRRERQLYVRYLGAVARAAEEIARSARREAIAIREQIEHEQQNSSADRVGDKTAADAAE